MYWCCHWACWFLDLLGWTLVQANVRHCLWLTSGNLFGTTKRSIVCGCLCWAWVCARKTKLYNMARYYQHGLESSSAKVPRCLKICLSFPLPVSCLLGSVTEKASGDTQVARGSFSVNHQVGMSGVLQIDISSNLMPVLGLRLLSNCPRAYLF